MQTKRERTEQPKRSQLLTADLELTNHTTEFHCLTKCPSLAWRANSLCGCRESNPATIHQEDGLVVKGHSAMHDSTVSVALNQGIQALMRITPADLQHLPASSVPPSRKSLQHLQSSQGILSTDEIDKRVSKTCSAQEVHWQVSKIVLAHQPKRVEGLQQLGLRVCTWQILEHQGRFLAVC